MGWGIKLIPTHTDGVGGLGLWRAGVVVEGSRGGRPFWWDVVILL